LGIFENIINHKINTITTGELLNYAKQFQISITREKAEKIASILRGRNANIFNESDRVQIIKDIARIAGKDTANEVNRLFLKFTK